MDGSSDVMEVMGTKTAREMKTSAIKQKEIHNN
jgi:hypothetical protein